MKRQGLWLVWGIIAGAALFLSGCATTASLQSVRVIAQKASVQGAQALAASRAIREHGHSVDQDLRKQMTALATNQKRLMRKLRHLQIVAAEMRAVRSTPRRPKANPPPRVPLAKDEANAILVQVIAKARTLASQPYKPPTPVAPVLQKLSFSDYSKLQFVGRVPGWPTGTPFHIQLDPAGYLFRWPEKIVTVVQGKTLPAQLPFAVTDDPGLAKRLPSSVPPAGFSVYTPFAKGPAVNEFLSLLGASYFRAVGAGQSWGLSARGVAVDTALPHRTEEFPYFRAFWLVASRPHAHHLAFCALLDSPSLTGAYRFVVRPGTDTIVDVKVVLFERQHVRRLGVAPLTSMFLQGRFSHRRFDHLVRSAHDSDGLLVAVPGGNRLWWPLRNPKRIGIFRFPLTNPQGFGLMQRARRAGDYRAYGMHYEDRPSAWVTPEGNWGPGHLLLVELPTNSETNDNMSVFWVPQNQAPPLQPMTFHYRIDWQGENPVGARWDYVVAARHAASGSQQETYVVNFTGRRLAAVTPAQLAPFVHVLGPGRVVNAWVTRNAVGDWRLQFAIARTGSGAVTIHAALMQGAARVTETWASRLPADIS